MLTIVSLLRTWIWRYFSPTPFWFVIANIMRARCSIKSIAIIASRSIPTRGINVLARMSTSLNWLLALRPWIRSRLIMMIVSSMRGERALLSSAGGIFHDLAIIHVSTSQSGRGPLRLPSLIRIIRLRGLSLEYVTWLLLHLGARVLLHLKIYSMSISLLKYRTLFVASGRLSLSLRNLLMKCRLIILLHLLWCGGRTEMRGNVRLSVRNDQATWGLRIEVEGFAVLGSRLRLGRH